jgi:hypothetical protein
MKRPYLLGHFDSDGYTTISRHGGKYVYGRWGIVGTPPVLDGVRAFLEAELGIARRTIYPKGRIAQLDVNGRAALAVDEWLHCGFDFGFAQKRLKGRVAA